MNKIQLQAYNRQASAALVAHRKSKGLRLIRLWVAKADAKQVFLYADDLPATKRLRALAVRAWRCQMITQSNLLDAIFWERGICLDCGSHFEVDDEGEDELPIRMGPLGVCGNCGSPRTYRAQEVKDILDRVEGEDGG